MTISYFTLYSSLEAGPDAWRVKNYNLYYNMNSSNKVLDYSELFSFKMNLNIKRIVSYYLMGNTAISSTNLGWGTKFNSENAKDLAETGKTAAKRHTKEINSEKHIEIFENNVLILKSIIKWCNINNIDVWLYTPPAFETYLQHLDQEQLKITIDYSSQICSSYENCVYENLLSDTNFVAVDFYDADHLSEIGAKKLSELLSEKINEW